MITMKEFLEKYYVPLKKENCCFREYDEDIDKRARNNYQRDYSRILYSSSFRRLQGKMQLLGIENDKFYRNRLTHSFEVAQIARGIADMIRSNVKEEDIGDVYRDDIYVLEAGALAHDIGNPPFGHHGEDVLNNLMKDFGGYEGNGQSVRVLRKLEKKIPRDCGLNVTFRTLLSIVKYYKNDPHLNKKYIYQEDFTWIQNQLVEKNLTIKPRTIDVQIIDLADEIAYAAHDLEDALSMKLFNMDEFIYELELEVKKGKLDDDSKMRLEDLIYDAKRFAMKGEVYQSSEEYSFLFRKDLISNIVNILIHDIGIVQVNDNMREDTGTQNKYELSYKSLESLAKSLKRKTFEAINRTDAVQLYEKQGERVIKGIFEALKDETFNKKGLLLPVEYRNTSKDNKSAKMRHISDFISGMMDSYAMSYYKQLYGENALNYMYDPSYFKEFK